MSSYTPAAEIEKLQRERDEAQALGMLHNNQVVGAIWALLGGPDASRIGGQDLVCRVSEVLARATSAEAKVAEMQEAAQLIVEQLASGFYDGESDMLWLSVRLGRVRALARALANGGAHG